MGKRVCGCSGWRRSGETRRTSAHVGEALLGSSAALALRSPQALGVQSAWLGGQERRSLTSRLLHTPCTRDHRQRPAVPFPIAPLWAREISGPELDTHRGHHPPSPMSVQDANRAGAYRQAVTRLPGLIFPRQDTAWRVAPGKGREESLGWSGRSG